MSALVGRFHVNIYEIEFFKRVETSRGFTRKVGVVIARRAVHFYDAHSREFAYAFKQIHGGNHTAAYSVTLGKVLQRGFSAFAPEPERVGGIFARLYPREIDGVVFKEFRRPFHYFEIDFSRFAFREIVFDGLSRDVVRRRKVARDFPAIGNETMPVTYARVKFMLVIIKPFREIADKNFRFFGGNFARAIIYHRLVPKIFFVGERNEISARGNVGIFKAYAYARRF